MAFIKGERITRKKLLSYLKGKEIAELLITAETVERDPVGGVAQVFGARGAAIALDVARGHCFDGEIPGGVGGDAGEDAFAPGPVRGEGAVPGGEVKPLALVFSHGWSPRARARVRVWWRPQVQATQESPRMR